MGEVYLATHVELGRPVALKVMHWKLSNDPSFLARFKREAIATTRIGHQHIVDVLDFGQTNDGRTFFAMEHLDGKTLGQALLAGPMPVARVVNVVGQVARALAAAHAGGVVHRDLKPDNVMLLQRPEQPDFVKVLDFGVAKVPPASGEAGHTMLGMVMGTPRYMAPEQARGLVVDARADIYSLGLIMYELITGRPAIDAESIADTLAKQLAEPLAPFQPGPLEDVPAALETLVFQMAEKDALARPQSMEEVIQRLRLLEEEPAVATSPAPPRSPLATASTLSPTCAPTFSPTFPPAPSPEPAPSQSLVPTVPVTAGTSVTPEPTVPVEAPAGRTAGPWLVGPARPFVLALLALAAVSVGGVVVGLLGAPTTGKLETAPATVTGTEPALTATATSTQLPSGPPTSLPSPLLVSSSPRSPRALPQTEDGRAPPRRGKVTLRLRSNPPGAEVRSGGRRLGRTPLDLAQPVGADVVFILTSEGHRPATLTVHPLADQTLTATLERRAPAVEPPDSAGDDPTVLK
jgi:serine/threonine-protein kinase